MSVAAADKIQLLLKMWRGIRHYCYTPYELADPTGDAVQNLLDTQKMGLRDPEREKCRGERRIPIRAYPALITKYPSYTAALLEHEHLGAGEGLSEAGRVL